MHDELVPLSSRIQIAFMLYQRLIIFVDGDCLIRVPTALARSIGASAPMVIEDGPRF